MARDNQTQQDFTPGDQPAREQQEGRLLARALLAKARRAREGDPVAFTELVMRVEKTRARIQRCAAVQELMMMFALFARDPQFRLPGKAVIVAPVEHTKSFSISQTLALRRIALFPETRAAIVSCSLDQARKVVNAIRDYIEHSTELQLVTPGLRPSENAGDPWTQNAFTVERTSAAHDPTLQAFGYGTKRLLGSRLDFAVIDDLMTAENTIDTDHCKVMRDWAQLYVLSRLGRGAHVVIVNSAMHPDDLPHYAIHVLKWPALIMSAYGQIQVFNTDFGNVGEAGEDLLEPEFPGSSTYVLSRVREKYRDDEEHQVLMPETFDRTRLEVIRASMDQTSFMRSYLSECRDNDTALCKVEDIDLCMLRGRQIGLLAPVHATVRGPGIDGAYHCTGRNPIFICVDLAFKFESRNDRTAIIVVELVPDILIRDAVGDKHLRGLRVILDLEVGRWGAPQIMDKIIRKYNAFVGRDDGGAAPGAVRERSPADVTVVVEDNGAQSMMRQFTLDKRVDIPVRPFTTDIKKKKLDVGVAQVLWEMSQGAWAWPNVNGRMTASMEQLRNDCLNYVPTKHTGDSLMSQWFARDACARRQAIMGQGQDPKRGGFAANLMAR